MDQFIDMETLRATTDQIQAWLLEDLLTVAAGAQVAVIIGAMIVGRLIAPAMRRALKKLTAKSTREHTVERTGKLIADLSMPIVWLLVQWIYVIVATGQNWPHHIVQIAVSLLTAWVVIRIASRLIHDPTWSGMVAWIAWSLAALNILGLLDDTVRILDSFAVDFGDLRVTALTVIKGLLSLAILLWVATLASRLLERRINTLPNLTPAVQVLFSKLLKIVLVTIAVVAALRTVGIDLTAFAVFSGAIGVGIGFGLQKVVSNLISGVILLLDKSVKPGDVIEVGQTYGWIKTLGARYASVITRDGTEYLIPNEDIITQQVVNWSYSDSRVRLKIPLGISYGSDVRKAIELCLEAASEVERVLGEPKSVCLLKGFGDSSVDLELRIWINDPTNGVSNVKSQVLLLIWDKFHANDIGIPFPQRDLHIRSADPLLPHVQALAS